MEAILIPVKRLEDAKGRLGARLTPGERRRLGLAMLSDVLAACVQWTLRLVVTSDPGAASTASDAGCAVLPDEGYGLNRAVEDGTGWLNMNGASKVLVLPADVPLAAPEDLAALFERQGVAVAPSADGGTNALLTSPPGIIRPAFGPRSAAAHKRAAAAAGASFELAAMPSLSLDVDLYRDLQTLAAAGAVRQSCLVAAELISREKVGEVP